MPAAALAIIEPHVLFDPFALRTTARRAGGGFVLDGVKSLVPRADTAELFIVAAALDGVPALFLVESGTAGITVESEPAMGLRAASMGRLVLADVQVPGGALLGARGRHGLRRVHPAVPARLGALALGHRPGRARLRDPLRQRAAGVRRADQPSPGGGVHGRQHRHRTRGSAAGHAAGRGRAEQGKSFAREAALARRLTTEYGMQIGSDGVQLLGGHGYVKEHPVERWYRDLRAVGVMEGVVLV